VLALFPYLVGAGTETILVQAFIILTLASMWNLLAGYAGLVSVGQQAFVGLGAYFVLILNIHNLSMFTALPVAAIGCGVAAVPMWWLVSRLRSGYFAIATWVLATTVLLIIEKFPSIGGGTGLSLPHTPSLSSAVLEAYTYWIGLAVTVLATITLYYELYVGGSVSTLILVNLHMTFTFYVITIAFGVLGKPRNSATPARRTLRSTAAIRSIRQCSACRVMSSSISLAWSSAKRKMSLAKPRVSSSTLERSAQKVVRTWVESCLPISD